MREKHIVHSEVDKIIKGKKRLANILFYIGLFFLFSGVALSLALFFVPDKYMAQLSKPILISYVLFFIDVPIYNHIATKIGKDKNSGNDT